MTEAVQIALIATIGPTLIGALNLLHQVIVARKVAAMGQSLKSGTEEIRRATNHMKDALVASTAKASRAEGVQAERDRVAAEVKFHENEK